ncbi:hypothetical protein F5Y08DRAFT_171148 [Xylaria arbuscula]|nr:hypothetical protein F5Y08DRAFT_171148 [Xylaria arbuscula]
MPRKHIIKVTVPIPPEVAPGDVVATLQTFEPLLDSHDYVVEYSPKEGRISDKDLAVIARDPFFAKERDDLPSQNIPLEEEQRWWLCDVWEDVYWVPFIVPYFSRLKRYLAVGYKTDSGIRFRQSVSGGVVTRGTFTVVSRETGQPYVRSWPTGSVDGESWDGETERGSIASNEEEAEMGENTIAGTGVYQHAHCRRTQKGWEAQDDTDAETEPSWDIVCACEIDVPLILVISQVLRRDENRALCEQLCKAIITATILAYR